MIHVVGFERHPPLDPALQCPRFVQPEIMGGLRAEQLDDPGEPIRLGRAPALPPPRARAQRGSGSLAEFCRRKHQIHLAGLDGAARHAVIAGFFRLLRDHQPALLLDRLQSGTAVGAGARKDDADGAGTKFLAQGNAAGNRTAGARRDAPAAASDAGRRPGGEIGPGRNDIEMVRLDRHAVRRLADFQSTYARPEARPACWHGSDRDAGPESRPRPESAGSASSSVRQASSPPAEAPIATTGKASAFAVDLQCKRERRAGSAEAFFAERFWTFSHAKPFAEDRLRNQDRAILSPKSRPD